MRVTKHVVPAVTEVVVKVPEKVSFDLRVSSDELDILLGLVGSCTPAAEIVYRMYERLKEARGSGSTFAVVPSAPLKFRSNNQDVDYLYMKNLKGSE